MKQIPHMFQGRLLILMQVICHQSKWNRILADVLSAQVARKQILREVVSSELPWMVGSSVAKTKALLSIRGIAYISNK